MNHCIDILFAAKNDLANTIIAAWKSGLTVKDYELVETESSKYREWSSPAEYENGYSCLDYAVMYNNARAVAALLMISRKTWEERNKFNKKDIENALRLAKSHNVSQMIIDLLLYANGEDIEEGVNPKGKPLTSDAREKYGSQGELIKEYLEHYDTYARNSYAFAKLEANEAKIKQVLMELQVALFDKLEVSSEDFFNDFERVKNSGITQEDLKTLCGFIEHIYNRDKYLTDLRSIRDAILKAVDEHGGIKSFPQEKLEPYQVIPPMKLYTFLKELAESKIGSLKGYGVIWDDVIENIEGELDKNTRECGEKARNAKNALDGMNEKYEHEYINRKVFEPNLRTDDVPWQWMPYNFENCVRLIKSGRKLH